MDEATRGLSKQQCHRPTVIPIRVLRRRGMLHGLDRTSPHSPSAVGSATERFGQPERGPLRGVGRSPAVLRVRDDSARPRRQDREVGGSQPPPAPRAGRSSLSAISASIEQAAGLRAFRRSLRADGSRRAPGIGWADPDREMRTGDEPQWSSPVQHRRDHGDPAFRDEGIVCPVGNNGIRRSSDLHEWRNDLTTVSTRDSAKLQCE